MPKRWFSCKRKTCPNCHDVARYQSFVRVATRSQGEIEYEDNDGQLDSIVIRTVDASNVEDVRYLIDAIFPFSYNNRFYKDVVHGYSGALLAYEGDQPVGTIVYTELNPRDQFHVLALGVAEGFRRRGIAETLFKLALRTTTCRLATLHVQTINDAAINLYLKLGFYYVNTHRNYYRNLQSSDAYLMHRKIKSKDRGSVEETLKKKKLSKFFRLFF